MQSVHVSSSAASFLATGFRKLDSALHRGGWPTNGLIELLCQRPCPQAVRLLLPALSRLQEGQIALVNPPERPHPHILKQAKIHTGNLLVMRSPDPDTLLRACRETAASGNVSALIAWLPTGSDTHANLTSLHLAAEQGHCLLIVIREARHAKHASAAAMRLMLHTAPSAQINIEVIKQPGGWGGQRLRLTLQPDSICPTMASTTRAPDSALPQKRSLDSGFIDPNSRFAYRSATRQPTSSVATPVALSAAAFTTASTTLTRNLTLPL